MLRNFKEFHSHLAYFDHSQKAVRMLLEGKELPRTVVVWKPKQKTWYLAQGPCYLWVGLGVRRPSPQPRRCRPFFVLSSLRVAGKAAAPLSGCYCCFSALSWERGKQTATAAALKRIVKLVRKAMRGSGLLIYRMQAGTWKTTASRGNVVITATQQERRIKLDSAMEGRNVGKDLIVKSDQVKIKFHSQPQTRSPCRRNVMSCGMPVEVTHLPSSLWGE